MKIELKDRRILVVEDEPHMLDLIRVTLESSGMIVSGAMSGEEALEKIREEMPDLVVLDLNLPGISGLEVLSELRQTSTVPVVMVTVQNDDQDRVMGLELGADDYLGKPFNHRELVSRIRAVLRRTETPAPVSRGLVKIDEDLQVDLDRRELLYKGEKVHLRPTEFKLLHQFMNHPGKLLTHETLLSRVWGPEYRDDTQILRLYVTYLRKKLESSGGPSRYIFNERGLGYRFVDYRNRDR